MKQRNEFLKKAAIRGTNVRLIFLRHGTAEDKSSDMSPFEDSQRELVKSGRKEVKKLIRKHPELFSKVHAIYVSSLPRAIETAEILYQKSGSDLFEMITMLDPEQDPADFVDAIEIVNDPTICIVGHEPFLTTVVKLLLKTSVLSIELAKGGAIVLQGETLKDLTLSHVIRP